MIVLYIHTPFQIDQNVGCYNFLKIRSLVMKLKKGDGHIFESCDLSLKICPSDTSPIDVHMQ